MKKSNFLKIVMTLVMAFAFSGAFAQTNITVTMADGLTAAAAATIVTAADPGTTVATADGSGVISVNLIASTRYIIFDANSKERYDFTASATQPQADFAVTLTAYSETNTTDMYQTAGTTFRLYVKPDPLYSPDYASDGSGINALSAWTWTLNGATQTATAPVTDGVAIAQNYVELTAGAAGTNTTISVAESFNAGCVDDGTEDQVINFVARPTATMTINPTAPATWSPIAAN